MKPEAPVRVLYIAASGRCGSTLLDRVLGQFPGVFAAGEVWHVWERSILGDGRCGCGEAFRVCSVWSEVFLEAFGGFDEGVAREMARRYQAMRTRSLPMVLTPVTWRRLLRRLGPYPANLEALYRAIQHVSGARLLIDASKDPLYALVLRSRPSVELWMLHLVRDPRAAAFSWTRRKQETGYEAPGYMPTYPPAVSAPMWAVLNEAAARFGRRHPERYLAVRYEDLVGAPEEVLGDIAAFVGEDLGAGPFVSPDTVHLEPTHSAWGNPSRFLSGDVQLRADDEWEAALASRDRALVEALTWPWLRRYGYDRLGQRCPPAVEVSLPHRLDLD